MSVVLSCRVSDEEAEKVKKIAGHFDEKLSETVKDAVLSTIKAEEDDGCLKATT